MKLDLMPLKHRRVRGRSLSRIGFNALIQVLSNASNFILTLLVAKQLGAPTVGVFAVLMAISGIMTCLARAWTAEPVVYRENVAESMGSDAKGWAAASAAAWSGTIGAVALSPFLLLILEDTAAVLVFAICIPLAIFQDCLRFVLVAQGKARRAFYGEAAWLIAQTAVLFAVASKDSLALMLAAWGIGCLAAIVCCGGGKWLRSLSPLRAIRWIVLVRRVSPIYSIDYLVGGGLSQGSILLVSVIAGLDNAGILRVSLLILTPLSVGFIAVTFALAPESARAASESALRRLTLIPYVYGAAVLVSTVLFLVTIFLIPQHVFELLVGPVAGDALRVLPAAALAVALGAISVGPGLVLRSLGQVGRATALKVSTAPVTLALIGLGAALGGAAGSQVGLAGGTSIRASGSLFVMHGSLRDRKLKSESLV